MADRAAVKALVQVEEDRWPSFLCPTCSAGHLRFGEVTETESAASRNAHTHEDWEPDWISGSFMSSAICNNDRCEEPVILAGDYSVEMGGSWGEQYVSVYRTRYANPSLPMMEFAPGTPEEVTSGVKRAAALLLLDPPAAANALRAAVERFLTVQGIASFQGGAFLSAHKRIEAWKQRTRNDAVANCFLAVKWIGNEGSHEDSNLTVAQVLDGAEILEYAFRLLFDRTGDRIAAAAAAINAAKGLPSASTP